MLKIYSKLNKQNREAYGINASYESHMPLKYCDFRKIEGTLQILKKPNTAIILKMTAVET